MKIGKIDIKINTNTLLVIGIAILALLLLRQCGVTEKLKASNQVFQQNQIALNDSIRVVTNKYGEEISLKNTLIGDVKELEKLNSELASDAKKLKGKVLYISNLLANVENDTVFVDNVVYEYPNGTKELNWSYYKDFGNGNTRNLSGFSRFSILQDSTNTFNILDKGTTISKDLMTIKLTTGLTELDDSYQIYVKTDYPGLEFGQIDGAILDKKRFMKQTQPTWVFGPSIYLGVGIDPGNSVAGTQIGLGISATFNLNKYINKVFNR